MICYNYAALNYWWVVNLGMHAADILGFYGYNGIHKERYDCWVCLRTGNFQAGVLAILRGKMMINQWV